MRNDAFAAGVGMPPAGTPEYAAWHGRWSATIRADQRTAQVGAAKGYVAQAREHRKNNEPQKATRALQRAAVERGIAARMPR